MASFDVAELSRLGALIRQLQGRVVRVEAVYAAFSGGRILRGTVSSAGALVSGTGFSASRSALGVYSITFTTAMSSAPSVTLGTGSTGGAYNVKASTAPTTAGFGVTAFVTTTGANQDGEFHFIAIG